MFKPRKAARRHTDPSETRFWQVHMPLRQRYGLTVREVADLLDNPQIAKCLSEFEAQIYKRLAYNNETKNDLARVLNLKHLSSLEVYLRGLEKQIIHQAFFVGVPLKETKAARQAEKKGKVPKDHYESMKDRTRETQDQVELMEYIDPGSCERED